MRIIKKKNTQIAEGDMTPMIDMVFQLIAFFMMLINFSKVDQDQRVNLPLSELAKPPEMAYEKPITLQMTKDEGIILNAGGDSLMTMDELRNALKREASIIRAAGKDVTLDDVTIVIRADKNARIGKVQEMMDAAQQAEFNAFALRGQQDQAQDQARVKAQ
ncbi:ExbD/TolR family protein [Aeoliella mucimassa]|uniref:Biopolymer transport protein ExbD n=1 Tax=Aeoliella mucimassa TaxID=2527972 RepID=A0A518AKP8_9BACT|nr:biopolymer transporter ExbD [Aeoliella mucimassa]QDU55299.1 Biopolymer transport protein ExbD [Aeoliella mucimassa]